jgi:calcineurin-like phosphoesterase family protein
MNTYFTSDTHFGHKNIIKHCSRPWSNMEEQTDGLVQNWNSVVSKKDTVYHLGDFAMFRANAVEDRMKEYRSVRARLNGKIHLVKGNHDQMNQEAYNCFTEVYDGMKEIKLDGTKVTLCHYPMRSWNCSFHGAFHFFGHVHGRMERDNIGLSCDVGVDVPDWKYTPVLWETLKEKLELKKQKNWEQTRKQATSRG